MFCHVIGTRPNFIKAFPIITEMDCHGMNSYIIHTGQHYDYKMSGVFFEDLPIPEPNKFLEIGSGSHGVQTAKALIGCEAVYEEIKPKAVIVYGDVNSTVAAALAAVKMHIPVIHIEAGCRSFDKTMPEEINRIMTDHLSNCHFCIDEQDIYNLLKENITSHNYVSGNIMIDALHYALSLPYKRIVLSSSYAVLTLHRPSNVDNLETLEKMLDCINALGIEVIYPVHPRIKSVIQNIIGKYKNIKPIEPLGYVSFVNLLKNAKYIITDSGGIQCEASVLGVPCFTVRNTTEHRLTLSEGTNVLCPCIDSLKSLVEGYTRVKKDIPMVWDGAASYRIVRIIKDIYGG